MDTNLLSGPSPLLTGPSLPVLAAVTEYGEERRSEPQQPALRTASDHAHISCPTGLDGEVSGPPRKPIASEE
jgi:hypothetical protein